MAATREQSIRYAVEQVLWQHWPLTKGSLATARERDVVRIAVEALLGSGLIVTALHERALSACKAHRRVRVRAFPSGYACDECADVGFEAERVESPDVNAAMRAIGQALSGVTLTPEQALEIAQEAEKRVAP